jgi:hypothetical protein
MEELSSSVFLSLQRRMAWNSGHRGEDDPSRSQWSLKAEAIDRVKGTRVKVQRRFNRCITEGRGPIFRVELAEHKLQRRGACRVSLPMGGRCRLPRRSRLASWGSIVDWSLNREVPTRTFAGLSPTSVHSLLTTTHQYE